jgi:hypothetical protein
MRIKAFQNFSLGKLGGKNKKDDPAVKDEQAAEIAELEEKVNSRSKDLKEAKEKLDELKAGAGLEIPVDDIPVVRPHGPAAELTVEDEDLQDTADIKLDEIDDDDSIKIGEDIKIAEVSVEKVAAAKAGAAIREEPEVSPAAAPAEGKKAEAEIKAETKEEPAEEKKEEKLEASDSLNNLFSSEEEEENPLASLINSLPDVTVQELLDDLAEIHRIINEWKPSSKTR